MTYLLVSNGPSGSYGKHLDLGISSICLLQVKIKLVGLEEAEKHASPYRS